MGCEALGKKQVKRVCVWGGGGPGKVNPHIYIFTNETCMTIVMSEGGGVNHS